MATIIKTIFQLKRGSSSRWVELNPILQQGEPGFEIDTGKLKIGNGVDTWINLSYVGDNSDSGIISVDTKSLLPETGNIFLIYRVIDERMLYQWNDDNKIYEPLNATDDLEINVNDIIQTDGDYLILYGGSATDNI